MKRIVIVGATSGIGREVARQLLRRGYRIGVAGRRETALQELKAEAPQQVACHKLDVTANDAPARLLALVEELGGMDVFLLSAGIGKQNAALQPGIELATAETNVLGFIRMVDTAYAYFREQGGGHLAVISSIAGTKGLGAAPAYSATKRFQNTYIEALAQLARMQRLNMIPASALRGMAAQCAKTIIHAIGALHQICVFLLHHCHHAFDHIRLDMIVAVDKHQISALRAVDAKVARRADPFISLGIIADLAADAGITLAHIAAAVT